jgi:hypothetical protein
LGSPVKLLAIKPKNIEFITLTIITILTTSMCDTSGQELTELTAHPHADKLDKGQFDVIYGYFDPKAKVRRDVCVKW